MGKPFEIDGDHDIGSGYDPPPPWLGYVVGLSGSYGVESTPLHGVFGRYSGQACTSADEACRSLPGFADGHH